MGPNAFVPQVKVVPQSGITLLSCRVADRDEDIGMNARSITTGDCSPDVADDEPERGGQAVGRRDGGDGDDGVGQQADGPVFQSLAVRWPRRWARRVVDRGHVLGFPLVSR